MLPPLPELLTRPLNAVRLYALEGIEPVDVRTRLGSDELSPNGIAVINLGTG